MASSGPNLGFLTRPLGGNRFRQPQATQAVAPLDVIQSRSIKPGEREAVNTRVTQDEGKTYVSVEASIIRFMSAADIRALSVCVCSNPDITMGTFESVNDPRMGPKSSRFACSTCDRVDLECPGHLGRIELARPFVHFLATSQTVWTLQSICNACAEPLLPDEVIHDHGLEHLSDLARLKETARLSAQTHHPGCEKNPTYITSIPKGTYNIMYTYKDVNHEVIKNEKPIEEILALFRRITPRNARRLGFRNDSHPINFIVEVVPVIPECNRPIVYRDGEIRHDHLTMAYSQIIKINNALREAMEKKRLGTGFTSGRAKREDRDISTVIAELERDLFFYLSHFIDNYDEKCSARLREDPIKSIKDRLTKKDGFFRYNAMGKRNNFSSRSVLGPRSITFGYIGYPESMRILTIPERVNARNLARLQLFYREGWILYVTPAVGRKRGMRIPIAALRNQVADYVPQIGDIVERVGMDGDETMFNRQPTLHKQSMMGYLARYQPFETIGIHSSATGPHNAD